MSSQRRKDASRRNGALSRGPKTPAGKAISSQNARTHELTAATVVLSNEDAPVLEAMRAAYNDYFQPQNPIEHDLVEELTVAKFRQRRLWAIETSAIDLQMDLQQPEIDKKYAQIDQPTQLAIAYKTLNDESKLLSNLSRYESRHRRAYEKAAAQLETSLLNRARQQAEISEHPVEDAPCGPANPGPLSTTDNAAEPVIQPSTEPRPSGSGLFTQPSTEPRPSGSGLFIQPSTEPRPSGSGLFTQPSTEPRPSGSGLFTQPSTEPRPSGSGLFTQPSTEPQPSGSGLFIQPSTEPRPSGSGLFQPENKIGKNKPSNENEHFRNSIYNSLPTAEATPLNPQTNEPARP